VEAGFSVIQAALWSTHGERMLHSSCLNEQSKR